MTSHIRHAAVAGLFYPGQSVQLASDVKSLFDEVTSAPIKGKIYGLVIPHAGYMYSGLTAAYGYHQVAGQKFDTIVIISPSHREYFNGITIYDGSSYETPLGAVPIDTVLREKLIAEGKPIIADEIGHRGEHAVEVHLPFLQYLGCADKFLPIVMGDQRSSLCSILAERLSGALHGTEALIIASSDLSHYHPYDEAKRLDRIVQEDIESFDGKRLLRDLDSERAEACGGGPVAVMLAAVHRLGATKAKVLHHCNSGDVTGDKDAVVGYLSAVAYQPT
jgi:hypothetical protein